MESVTECEISSKEFKSESSSSDEELPPVLPFNLSTSFKSTTSKKSEKSLKELLKEHSNLAESIKGDNISQNNIEQKIKNMHIEVFPEEVELEPLEDTEKNPLYCANDSLNFFNSRDVSPILCGYQHLSDGLTLLEKDMLSFVRVELENTLSSFLFTCHPCCISDCKSFVNFLLCNISVSSDAACINACYNKLISVLMEHPGALDISFSSAEVFMLLFNYGIDVENCPILQRPGIKKHLSTPKNLGKNLNKIPDNWTFNLQVMLNALNKLMLTCDFKSKDIPNILVYFLWMCLDDTLLKENLYYNLQECILSCLECLTTDNWIINLLDVASIVITLFYSEKENLHAIYQMTESIPSTSERSIYLKRQISFLTVKLICSNDSNSEVDLNCEFNLDEFKTLILMLAKKEPDSSLYLAAKFVDLCISHLNATEETYLSLFNILKVSESVMHEKATEAKLVFLKIHTRLNLMTDSSVYKIKVETEESSGGWNEDSSRQILNGNNMNFIQIKTEQVIDSYDALIPGNNHASNEFLMQAHSEQNESSEGKQTEGTSVSATYCSFEASTKEFIPLINEEAVKQEIEDVNILPNKDAFVQPNIIVSSVVGCAASSVIENMGVGMSVVQSFNSESEPSSTMPLSDEPMISDPTPIITKVRSGDSVDTDFESPVIPYDTICHHSVSELTSENEKSKPLVEQSSHNSQEFLSKLNTIHSVPAYADFHLPMCTVKIVDIMLKPQSTAIPVNDIVEISKESVEKESNFCKISENKSLNVSNRVEHILESYCQPGINCNLSKNDFDNSYSLIHKSLNTDTTHDNLINSNHMFENVPKLRLSSEEKINSCISDTGVSKVSFFKNTESEVILSAKSSICGDDPYNKDNVSKNIENDIFLPRVETPVLKKNLKIQPKTNISETSKYKIEKEPEIIFLNKSTSPDESITNFSATHFGNTLPKHINGNVTKKIKDDDLTDDEVMIIKEVKFSCKKSTLKLSGNTLKKNTHLVNEIKDISSPHFTVNKAQTKKSDVSASTSGANYNLPKVASNYESSISPQFVSSFNKNQSSDEVIILPRRDSFSNTRKESNKCVNPPWITSSFSSESSIPNDYEEIIILKEVKKSPSKRNTDNMNKKSNIVSQPSCVINLDVDGSTIEANSWKKNEAYNLNRLNYYEHLTELKYSHQHQESNSGIKRPRIQNKVDNFTNLNNELSGAENSTEYYESNDDASLNMLLELAKSVTKANSCSKHWMKDKVSLLDNSVSDIVADNEFQCIGSENGLLLNEDEEFKLSNTDLTIKNISKNLSSSYSNANHYVNKDLNISESKIIHKVENAEIKSLLNSMVGLLENQNKKCSIDKLCKLSIEAPKSISALHGENTASFAKKCYAKVPNKNLPKPSSSFYSPVQDKSKSFVKVSHEQNHKKCEKQVRKEKLEGKKIHSRKRTFHILPPNSAIYNKLHQSTSIMKNKRILKNQKENCLKKGEKILSPSKMQSSKNLNSLAANVAYKRKLTYAFHRNSPKKYLSNSMKNARFKSYLSQTGLTFPQLLREKIMPSYSRQGTIPEQTICEEDSDIEILYTDPKKFSDSDCKIVFETEDLFIID